MTGLLRIFSKFMDSSVVPEDWKATCIVLVYKGKGDRGISILSIPGKTYGRVLVSRVVESTK